MVSAPQTDTTPRNRFASGLDRFFAITHRGSTIPREIRGGLVSFVTMAYIVILNPLILGGFSQDQAPQDVVGGWLLIAVPPGSATTRAASASAAPRSGTEA